MSEDQEDKKVQQPITTAMEDYLEAIFTLDRDKKVARVKDIAQKLNVKMPTVTSMLKTLNKKGLVEYERYEYIKLTEEGAEIGREVRKKHDILREFLSSILKIDDQIAESDACKMEHDLSAATLNSLVDFMEFIQTCPRAGESWLEHFNEFRLHGHRPDTCSERCKEFSSEIRKRGDNLQDQGIGGEEI